MERSIENVWTRGFLKNEELLAPKITNLYNRKSQLIIEKIKRTYQADNKSLLPLAAIFALGFGYFGHVILGIFVMALMITLFIINRRLIENLENIKIESNTYAYLLEYRKAIHKIIRFSNRLIGFALPVAGILIYWSLWKNTSIMAEMEQVDNFYLVIAVLGVAVALSLVGMGAYRIATKVLYGRLIKKLDEVIADMRELTR